MNKKYAFTEDANISNIKYPWFPNRCWTNCILRDIIVSVILFGILPSQLDQEWVTAFVTLYCDPTHQNGSGY